MVMITLMTIGLVRHVLCTHDLSGLVTAVPDGQTLVMGDLRIRLNEIVIASSSTSSGAEARSILRSLALGREVDCRVCQRSGSAVFATGRCQSADGQDLGQTLIAAGLARDCVVVSGGRLSIFETAEGKEIPLPEHCLPGSLHGPIPRISIR